MSLAGRIAIRGSTVTIRRATSARAKDNSSKLTWGTVTAGVKAMFDEPTAEIRERIYGEESRAQLIAYFPLGTDIIEKDGVIVTAGWKSGETYQVEKRRELDQNFRAKHLEVSLTSTPETFA